MSSTAQPRVPPLLPWLGAGALLAVLQGVRPLLDGLVAWGFCLPAACAASWMLNAPLDLTEPAAPTLLLSDRALTVAAPCGGYDFFTVSAATLLWFALARRKSVLPALPLAWLVTVSANSVRVTALAWFAPAGKILLPANWQSAAHLGLGVAVFLPCLLLLVFLTERNAHAR